jgi:anti-sigma regulatory factor (Ser/Thr protein kinase)
MADFLIDGSAIGQIEQTLQDLSTTTPGGDVLLRFDNHWAQESAQPALLGAALMGTLADRNLTVDVVDQDAVDRLMRFGVASALWLRPRGKTHFAAGAEALDRSSLGAVWTVGSRATTDALFATEEPNSAGTVAPGHATFVNSHLSSGEDGQPDIVFLVRRWLTRRAIESEAVDVVGLALGELIANVHEHASGPRGARFDSLVRVAIDSGAVRCSVLDSGVGIPSSIASKVGADDVGASDLLRRLLAGELERWHHGRGIGLARVVKLVGRRGGGLSLATDTSRAEVGNGAVAVKASGFSLRGTVVDFSVPSSESLR